jgi:hypothetical protein
MRYELEEGTEEFFSAIICPTLYIERRKIMRIYYTQVEVAEAARTSASFLNACIRKGVIPAPGQQVGLRRYYDQAARDQIVTMFEARRQSKIDALVSKQKEQCDG